MAMAGLFIALWTYTLVGTPDRANWALENALVFIALGALFLSFKRTQFSDLSYLLMFVYLCLHVYGAMYTYAENPFGYWLMERFDLERNHYDRIVHFSFGLLMAYSMRELAIRIGTAGQTCVVSTLRGGKGPRNAAEYRGPSRLGEPRLH